MVFTRSCACHSVAVFLGLMLGKGYHDLWQCLREWCYEAADQRGVNRQALDETNCFAPLPCWVPHLWPITQVTLALDVTSMGDRFVVLTIQCRVRGLRHSGRLESAARAGKTCLAARVAACAASA